MTISRLPLACPPRFSSPRNEDRQTLGGSAGAVAKILGKPLMPWQQHVADVALEVDPDTGRLAYREVRLTVPRQSGKTLLILALACLRCRASEFYGPRQVVVYTAQTRKDARKKFKEDYEPDLTLGDRLKAKPSWAPGDEHVRFPNRSRFGIESTTEKAGHGSTIDMAFIDEAFAQVDNRLEQAFGPAMITRRNVQTLVISTAGWQDSSPYLWTKVKHGRQLVEDGSPSRIAYFEWSAPQDADPFDRDVWRTCMPALGFTIDEEAIEAELATMLASEDGLNGFRRAYLNQWVPKQTTSMALPLDLLVACGDATSQIDGTPKLVVSMSPDQSHVTLAAAGWRTDGLIHGEVVLDGAAGEWFVPKVAEITRRQRTKLWLHPGHPAGSLMADLIKAGIRVETLNGTDYAQGCGAFYRSVLDRTFRYPAPQPELEAAVTKATQRRSGDTWKWDGDGITALVAVTQAAQVVRASPARGQGRVIVMN